jgi:adenylate cyclase
MCPMNPDFVEAPVGQPDEREIPRMQPITVLFVHLQGYVPLCEHIRPENVITLLSVYLEEVSQSVIRFDGTILKYLGGQVMAIWNAPASQADHSIRAVRSASDILLRSAGINRALQERGLPAIRFGIGVSTGEAIVGMIGSTLHKQYDVIGDAVNTAVLLSRAAGSEILLSEATREAIGNSVEVEEIEPLRLTGKREVLRIYRLIVDSA